MWTVIYELITEEDQSCRVAQCSLMFPSSNKTTSRGVTPSSANSKSIQTLDMIKIDRSHNCPYLQLFLLTVSTATHLHSVQCLGHVSPSLPNNLQNTKHAEHVNTELGTGH